MLIAAKESAIQDMEQFIKQAYEKIEQRRADLMNQILDQFNTQQNILLDKQKEIQETVERLKHNITDAENLTQVGDLNGLEPISEILKSINEEMRSISSNLDLGKNYLTFDPNEGLDELSKCLCHLGQICTKGFLPTTVAFAGTELKVGFKATLTVDVCGHHGDTVPLPPDNLSVQITDPMDTKLDTLLSTSSSECTITFTPQIKGLHKISGMFLGEQLLCKQSHISIIGNNPGWTFGGDGPGEGEFDNPWGIAIDNKNNCLYVADTGNKLIQKFTTDGDFLSQFSVAVHNENHTTRDIALDVNEGLAYCIELPDKAFVGNKILVFNLDGELQNTYTLKDPWTAFSIAVDQQGDLIMSSIDLECIFKVDKEGNFVSRMAQVKDPGYIFIDQDNSIIVPDETDDCIYILNPDGTVRHKFGTSGTGKGQLRRPRGVTADGEYILVSDNQNDRVQVFNYDGAFVYTIDSAADQLNGPSGLDFSTDGYVSVVDSINNYIKQYKYRDTSW